ncbi:glycosyltransferase family 2 protein [Bacteroides eggerthii]|jgi:hypothetical protein|uniref:Putative glycosyltransferase n=1 Tax=Bacteroides eggerthii TaxID=28111 RepID=A0A380YL97_9BACE|nr:glycosyltransferase family 2 protein [Bacteroides eggerthii]EEC53957.1 glycosyltransferase, group 2 family protein [Bacteroides eggerthii DSM 20697]QRQ47925.1 glycosyltransferase [Bacteroides eggerthii]UWN86525.1 glycosyltransferase [Bacteroides eggerthii]SUV28896.1 putative glycosyltransferase [Bacteroides eggerthii]
MNKHFVSIICPVSNEEKYIERCVKSVIEQDYPKELMEILYVDGMSTDNTRSIILNYVQKYSFIKLLDNPNKIVSPALNIGINNSIGDVIVRLDGHCIYPSNYISRLVYNLYHLKADNVGAVLNTLPAHETSVCRAIAIGMSHRFGVGNSLCRIGANEVMQADTVPFGCFKKEIFDKLGGFDLDLVRNQDDEFNARIIKNGGKIFLIPDLVIDYYARDKISKMSKMFYQYGLFKPLVNKKLGSPATIRQFFPVMFLLGLIVGIPLSYINIYFAIIYLVVILFYCILAVYFSLKEVKKWRDWNLIFFLPITFLIIHLSYGWGYFKGIYQVLMGYSFSAKTNR